MKKAVSFIELVVVLAIIGILAAVTLPTIRNYLPGWQLSGSAKLLVNKLRQAQEEAVTTQNQYLIRFHPSTDLAANPATYELIKRGGPTLETVTLPKNIALSPDASFFDQETEVYQVFFSADGGPSSSGNITLTYGSASRIINISTAGVIKL